jgi:hypothetical protein
MDFDSFSHGQIASKLWLCEELEKFLAPRRKIMILGSWHNVLGFMMAVRKPDYYSNILGIDIDNNSIEIANKITDAWRFNDVTTIENICDNANNIDFPNDSSIINCSPEHFEDTSWFDNMPNGTHLCIQSSSMTDTEHPWYIRQPTPNIETFTEKYPMSKIQYIGARKIEYDDWGYSRFMVIGFK